MFTRRNWFSIVAAIMLVLSSILFIPGSIAFANGTNVEAGTLAGTGTEYIIEIPANWNGTLFLYSHGYANPTPGNYPVAQDAENPASHDYLLARGYALAGTSFNLYNTDPPTPGSGWAVEQAMMTQMNLLGYFDQKFNKGKQTTTIAWGPSLGGLITAGLIQKYSDRFAGALTLSGVLAGGVGIWNVALDGAFVFKTLLAPDKPLVLTGIKDPNSNLGLAWQLLEDAQNNRIGRARLALVAAIGDVPGWFGNTGYPISPEPAPNDYSGREYNQYLWLQNIAFPFSFAFRADLEARANGNPSWNTGVNYRVTFAHSINKDEVKALYDQAGLNLEDDLNKLGQAPRVSADPAAFNYLSHNITFNGEINVPMLAMHTTADGLILVQSEQAYASLVRAAGNNPLLRQAYVYRAGHTFFTPAEVIAGLEALLARLESGKWSNLATPGWLNAAAEAQGPLNNYLGPAFINYQPSIFPRPFPVVSSN